MNDRYDYKRKKLRGWKRKVKEVERWQSNYINMDVELFRKNARDYVKLWGCPFYSLRKYTLPFWYKHLIIDSLIEIYDSWKKTLDQLNEPYYLKIWIFEENIMSSQVVASYGELLHFYEHTFSKVAKVETLPDELMTNNTKSLSWYQGMLLTPYSENELQHYEKNGLYTSEELQKLKQSAYSTEKETGNIIYLIKEDTVWLGHTPQECDQLSNPE